MAEIDETVDANIEEGDRSATGARSQPKRAKKKKSKPSYRLAGDSKIPVSKDMGKVWESRKSAGLSSMSELTEAWEEAIKYFHHDQMAHRSGDTENRTGNRRYTRFINDELTETENVVFSNVTTMVPALYARNPRAEFTTTKVNDEDEKTFATLLERLVNTLAHKKVHPGINLKPKAKRCVVTASLTNRAWLEVGWNFKEDSSDQVVQDLAEISKVLSDKKSSRKKIEEAEGKLQALEQAVDVLEPSGPFMR